MSERDLLERLGAMLCHNCKESNVTEKDFHWVVTSSDPDDLYYVPVCPDCVNEHPRTFFKYLGA